MLKLEFYSLRFGKRDKELLKSWSEEEINDFTRKLGLLGKREGKQEKGENADNRTASQVHNFQSIFKVRKQLLFLLLSHLFSYVFNYCRLQEKFRMC